MRKRTQSMLRRIPVWSGLFLALLLAALVGTVLASVNNSGLFELDGDATTGNITDIFPTYTKADDWQALVAGTHYNTTDASAFQVFSGILADPGHGSGTNVSDSTTFMTGGSKDINDISSWRWSAGSIPAKDDITNAYAAAYSEPASSGPPHLVVYFGADRYANNGSAQMGFWFLQNKLSSTLPADGSFGTTHEPGDILILANFSGSAVLNGFAVYEWVGTGGDQKGGTLDTLIAPESAACGTSSADPRGCAISNSTDIPLYWAYTAKAPTSPVPDLCVGATGCAPPASFFEGGVDLTALLGSTPCLATFLAETRSSSGSVTAQLEDFVYGSFPVCGFSVDKTCGGGTPDGDYIQYSYGGVVYNEHGALTHVTVTDTFPSDVKNIVSSDIQPTCDSNDPNVCSFDIGTIDDGYCQTWPNVRSGTLNTGFPCSDLASKGGSFTPDFSGNTFETKTNGADNLVSNAVANGGTVEGTPYGGSTWPFTASCPAGPAPRLTAGKSCSVSVSSSLVISVGDNGYVCNQSGYTISNLAGTDVQTDTTYTPLRGFSPITLTFKDNSNTTTHTLQPCPNPGSCVSTDQTGDNANTCATFTGGYTPSQASGDSDACTDVFDDVITVTGNYLGGTGTTDQVTKQARASCPLCGCSTSSPTTSTSSAITTTSTTTHGRGRH